MRRDVLATQLKRIHAERLGERVQSHLEPDRTLGVTRRAKRGHRCAVHEGERLVRAHIGALIQLVIDLAGAAFPSPDAKRDFGHKIDRGEYAIFGGADREALQTRRPVAGVDLLTSAINDTGHSATESFGEERGDVGMRGGVVLGAEAAAHGLADHADVGERDAEVLGEIVAHAENSLRAFPHREMIAIPLGDGAMWLECGVEHAGRAHLARDGDIGGGEPSGDITAGVGAGFFEEEIVREPWAHGLGVGGDGLRDGRGVPKLFDLKSHQCRGPFGDLLSLRADCDEGLPVIGDLGAKELGARGDIGGEQHIEHTGQCTRCCGVDRDHAPARDLRADDGRVHLMRPTNVGGVSGPPGRLHQRIDATRARTDVRECGVSAPRLEIEGRHLHDALLGAPLDLHAGGDKAFSHWRPPVARPRRVAPRGRSSDTSRSDRDSRSWPRRSLRWRDSRCAPRATRPP